MRSKRVKIIKSLILGLLLWLVFYFIHLIIGFREHAVLRSFIMAVGIDFWFYKYK
jgi:hypothetical protein